MAKKQYAYQIRKIAATPRNKRLTEGIQQAAQTGGGGGGITVVPSAPVIDIIASDSQVLPTDDNVFSAARTLVEINNAFTGASAIFDKRYLRKDVDDMAAGNIRFAKQISSEAFASGLTGTGWRITQEGDGEMRSLFLREWLETPELRYNRVTVTGDEFWVATGVKADKVSGNTITAKLEEGEVSGTIHVLKAGKLLGNSLRYAVVIEFGADADAKKAMAQYLEDEDVKSFFEDVQSADCVNGNCILIPVMASLNKDALTGMVKAFKGE